MEIRQGSAERKAGTERLADQRGGKLPLSTGAAGRAPLSARGDDLYETPAVAVHALLDVEPFPAVVWEPACGPGAIVDVLRAKGHTVIATDIADYGAGHAHGIDFLLEHKVPPGVGAILTNPPYKLADEFVTHALDLRVPKIAMLLRLAFLESERRRSILDGGSLARVYVFRNRLPMMHRASWDGARASNAVAFAWFVWELGHRGRTELGRISWKPATGALRSRV